MRRERLCACVRSRVARGAQLKACERANPPVQDNQIGNGAAMCIGAAIQADQASRSPLPATSAPGPAWARGARSQPSQASHAQMGCATVARIPSHTAATCGGSGSCGAIGACFTRLVLVHLFVWLRGQRLQVLNLFHNVIGAQATRSIRHTTWRSTIQRATSYNIIQRAARNIIQRSARSTIQRAAFRGRRRAAVHAAAGVAHCGRTVSSSARRSGRGGV